MDQDTNNSTGWPSAFLRKNVLSKIEEAIRHSNNRITGKTPLEMEQHIFTRTKSREDYLEYVARLIIHLKDSKAKQGGQPGGPMGDGSGGSGVVSVPGGGGGGPNNGNTNNMMGGFNYSAGKIPK